MPKKQVTEFKYEGGDLEAMLAADNYYRWIFDDIKPYVGKSVIEVGSGVGSFSKLILKTKPKTVHLIEPSADMHKQLVKNISDKNSSTTNVHTHNGYLNGSEKSLKASKPDTFIYINVFEHIEDDTAEMKKIADLLEPGGHVIIFVPALGALYSNFDKSIGHFRRYNKKKLKELCDRTGLEITSLSYRDIFGIMSWWLSFVILKRRGLSPSLVKTYDDHFVPVIRAVESKIEMPLGKNLLLIAKKPQK
jgi:FkbM family methyltransferase